MAASLFERIRYPENILGIDIGSSAIAVAEINATGECVKATYCFHHGQVDDHLKRALRQFDLSCIAGIAATASTPSTVKVSHRYDNRVATMAAARQYYPQARSILNIGAEKFGLIQLDRQGNYRTFRANSGCAAGTGSFLDQQAQRLKLKDAAALSALARNNAGAIPKIASRCAVFAKTDLAHAQQEGYLLEEICDGLCYGLAKNVVDVLFSGQTPLGPVLLTGGVANNLAVAEHIRDLIGLALIVARYPCEAVGAALCLLGQEGRQEPLQPLSAETIIIPQSFEKQLYHDPIELTRSDYPAFANPHAYTETRWDNSNPVEVDLYKNLEPLAGQGVYLGIDVGSTSTKAVLMTRSCRVVAGFYNRTAGRPVNAAQNLLAAIDALLEKQKVDLEICGVATTGSGRKFAGRIVGADLIIDEITAHAKAATALNPAVDTIIEIGGQDSKFTTLQNGRVTFSAMNAVCAAGNGMQYAGVYTGRLSLTDISIKLPVNNYLAYMFGGLLKKIACRLRPYEKFLGTTDRVIRKSLALLEGAFRWHRSKEAALAQVIEWFEAIERRDEDLVHRRPKVAIFGDIYVRDNELINQNLIHFIEAHGGEVVTTPYSTFVKMIAKPYLRKWFVEGHYLEALSSKALIATISHLEKTYYKYFQRILEEPEPVYDESPEHILSTYGIRIENTGEAMENILEIYYLKKSHPDIALFVQTSPAFCCPSLITEAMAATIQKITHTPISTITYDGTGGDKNEVIIPYLEFPRQDEREELFRQTATNTFRNSI